MTTCAQVARDHLVTAIDLTRACAESDLYVQWLFLHSDTLGGAAGIANYFVMATIAFEEQAHPQLPAGFDPFVARECLSDILMASAPLSSEELRAAVTAAIHEASEETEPECPPETAPLTTYVLTVSPESNNPQGTQMNQVPRKP